MFTNHVYTTNERSKVVNKLQNAIRDQSKKTIYRYSDRIIDNCLSRVKRHFGFEIIVSPNMMMQSNFKMFVDWVSSIDKNLQKHTTDDKLLKNANILVKIDKNTYCLILSGKYYIDNKSINEIMSYNDSCLNDIYVYIFGKKSYKYYKMVKKLVTPDSRLLYSLKVTGSEYNDDMFQVTSSELKTRNFSTIYLENDVTTKIKSHIDNFLKNKPIYETRNLRYKTGILMEGEPGTGKTSLATAIATEYKCDLIVVDMNTFDKINALALSETIDADDDMYVVLLEDIDCVIGDRDDTNIDKEEKALVNKLLQFLDSSSSPTNVIFIATTNHPEKLDAAIKRDGRFDLIVEVKGVYKDNVIKMCKSFNISDEDLKNILSEIGDNYPVNQSWLQNRILKTFENEDAVVI